MRLIDADEFREEMIGVGYDWESVLDMMPTIDAVEVVRCRDCKWLKKWDDGEQTCRRIGVGYIVGDNDYCSYGERESDETVRDK